MDEWIKVETDLPDKDCLVCIPEPMKGGLRIHSAKVIDGKIFIVGGNFYFDMPAVTHWMPLPAPPTTEAEQITETG